MPVLRQCLICLTKFPVSPSRAKKGRGLYCSTKCHGISKSSTPLSELFFAKVNQDTCLGDVCGCHKGIGHCWPWMATGTKWGYGWFKVNGKGRGAHRAAFFIEYGRWPIPFALHHCDNSVCCRISHIYEGTHLDNVRDMCERGRISHGEKHSITVRGEHNGTTKITEQQAILILNLLEEKEITQRSISIELGISYYIVNSIANNASWKYLTNVGIRKHSRNKPL